MWLRFLHNSHNLRMNYDCKQIFKQIQISIQIQFYKKPKIGKDEYFVIIFSPFLHQNFELFLFSSYLHFCLLSFLKCCFLLVSSKSNTLIHLYHHHKHSNQVQNLLLSTFQVSAIQGERKR